MKAVTKILAGGAALAALVSAAPAAAQYGYGQPYGGYGYGGGGNVIGTILNQILGGRNYATNERYAVEQCVRAVEYRINTRGLDNERGRYTQYGYGYGYNNGYANGYQGARVVAVQQVERRSNGGLRIYGTASTGMGGYPQQYGYGGYNNNRYGGGYGYNGYAQAGDAQFKCNVDRSGRITDIDASRSYGQNYGYRRY